MVVSARWLTTILGDGGSFDYTRDTTPLPAMAQQFMGVCSNTNFWDQRSCQSNLATWTPQRRDYNTMFGGSPNAAELSWADLEAIREDINIIEMTRWSAMGSLDPSDEAAMMEAMETAEAAFYNKVYDSGGLVDNITGTTNGTTAISLVLKKALLTVFLQPEF